MPLPLPQPVPVTILTGFLGAGKTSLLNHMLRGDHGLRIAVLVNDFGELNIDAELVEGVRDDMVSLRNGCICCSIRGDLLAAALRLVNQEHPPEYVLIECSGVADPVAVARTFLLPELRERMSLDSAITVVDAEQVHQLDEYQDLIADQIAAADIVVLNKVDLASANLRAGLHEWISMIVPNARVIEAAHGRVPLELVLGVGSYGRALERYEADHYHASEFASWSFSAEQPFAFHALRRALETLPEQIFRGKGVLWVAEEPQRKVVFQLVGRRVTLTPQMAWDDSPRVSKLVLIGMPGSVDGEALQLRFQTCLLDLP